MIIDLDYIKNLGCFSFCYSELFFKGVKSKNIDFTIRMRHRGRLVDYTYKVSSSTLGNIEESLREIKDDLLNLELDLDNLSHVLLKQYLLTL